MVEGAHHLLSGPEGGLHERQCGFVVWESTETRLSLLIHLPHLIVLRTMPSEPRKSLGAKGLTLIGNRTKRDSDALRIGSSASQVIDKSPTNFLRSIAGLVTALTGLIDASLVGLGVLTETSARALPRALLGVASIGRAWMVLMTCRRD